MSNLPDDGKPANPYQKPGERERPPSVYDRVPGWTPLKAERRIRARAAAAQRAYRAAQARGEVR